MSLRINQNTASTMTHRQLQASDAAMASSIEKLSTGFKINRAADDPAGLVISENLRAQVSGIGQAISNSNDAVNLVRTAEGALSEVHSLLRTMRDLSVHAANTGANDSTAIEADQTQIKSMVEALDRIASNTAFGNMKLLNGTGATTPTNLDTTHIASIQAASSNSLISTTGYMDVTVDTAATKAKVTGSENVVAGNNLGGNNTITINGTKIGDFTAANTVQDVVNAINLETDTTGVAASITGGKLVLEQTSYGSDGYVAFSETGTDFNNGSTAFATGIDIEAHAHIAGGAAINFTSGKGLVAESANGDKITLESAGNTAAATYSSAAYVKGGTLTFQIGANAGETASVSISSTAANKLGTASGHGSVADIDVTSNASNAIEVLDAAISQVSTQRATLGAFQKNLESNMNSLGVAKENIAASESAIRDTDMAGEMVKFTRNQIMMQAGTSMLTQANQAPQQLLSLLR